MAAQWVSVTVYAETYSVDRDTVYKWMRAGLVETFRVGKLIRVWNAPPSDKRPPVRVTHAVMSLH